MNIEQKIKKLMELLDQQKEPEKSRNMEQNASPSEKVVTNATEPMEPERPGSLAGLTPLEIKLLEIDGFLTELEEEWLFTKNILIGDGIYRMTMPNLKAARRKQQTKIKIGDI